MPPLSSFAPDRAPDNEDSHPAAFWDLSPEGHPWRRNTAELRPRREVVAPFDLCTLQSYGMGVSMFDLGELDLSGLDSADLTSRVAATIPPGVHKDTRIQLVQRVDPSRSHWEELARPTCSVYLLVWGRAPDAPDLAGMVAAQLTTVFASDPQEPPRGEPALLTYEAVASSRVAKECLTRSRSFRAKLALLAVRALPLPECPGIVEPCGTQLRACAGAPLCYIAVTEHGAVCVNDFNLVTAGWACYEHGPTAGVTVFACSRPGRGDRSVDGPGATRCCNGIPSTCPLATVPGSPPLCRRADRAAPSLNSALWRHRPGSLWWPAQPPCAAGGADGEESDDAATEASTTGEVAAAYADLRESVVNSIQRLVGEPAPPVPGEPHSGTEDGGPPARCAVPWPPGVSVGGNHPGRTACNHVSALPHARAAVDPVRCALSTLATGGWTITRCRTIAAVYASPVAENNGMLYGCLPDTFGNLVRHAPPDATHLLIPNTERWQEELTRMSPIKVPFHFMNATTAVLSNDNTAVVCYRIPIADLVRVAAGASHSDGA